MAAKSDSIVIKCVIMGSGDVMRLRLEGPLVYEDLRAALSGAFDPPLLKSKYEDDEGDWCMLTATSFDDFVYLNTGPVVKLRVWTETPEVQYPRQSCQTGQTKTIQLDNINGKDVANKDTRIAKETVRLDELAAKEAKRAAEEEFNKTATQEREKETKRGATEEVMVRKKAVEEEHARNKAEEAAQRKAAEYLETKRTASDDISAKQKAAEEEAKKKAAAEAEKERRKEAAEGEQAKKRAEEAARRKAAEEHEIKRKAAEEASSQRMSAEEDARMNAAKETTNTNAADEEETVRTMAAMEGDARKFTDEVARQKEAEEFEAMRKTAVDAAAKMKAGEDDAVMRAVEEAIEKKAPEEEAEVRKWAAKDEHARKKADETARQETERKTAKKTQRTAIEKNIEITVAEEKSVQIKPAEESNTNATEKDAAKSAEVEEVRKKKARRKDREEADDMINGIYARNTLELIEERREKLKTEGGRTCRCSRCIREEVEHAQVARAVVHSKKQNASIQRKNLQAENVLRHSGLVPAATLSEIVDGAVVLFDAGAPHGRLRMHQNGIVDMLGGHGTWTNFVVHLRPSNAQSDSTQVVLQSKPQPQRYLSFSTGKGLTYKTLDDDGSGHFDDECTFRLSVTECGQDGYVFELRPAIVGSINLHPLSKGFKVYLKHV